ncbi:HIT domain-containing protein [Modicisalibacter tunisiensis]|uniref:HIT domain-containing protein n=1 Tax=Modicisalibacter tunisiensis TaxID=390637 RepID=UPI001CCDECD8|nr:HIT domain-containing protein [Modicisalibacter tunisiensis]MBZ9539353.1 HIT domain-containing protein [Modicisalibacter tunisiensis]
MTDFTLDDRLAADTHFLADLPLCQVRLMNDARFAWLILVPRRNGVVEVGGLSEAEQARLWHEATRLGEALKADLDGAKLNLATLGNQVPQLHFHVIVRRHDDAAWPGPVWGVGTPEPYSARAVEGWRARIERLAAPLMAG